MLKTKTNTTSSPADKGMPMGMLEHETDPVIGFIESFYDGKTADEQEVIREQFRAGYCWYFASMLEALFPEGRKVWCAPYSHIAFELNGKVYDAEGRCDIDSKVYAYIPISYLGRHEDAFKHRPDLDESYIPITEQEIEEIIKLYEEDEGIKHEH